LTGFAEELEKGTDFIADVARIVKRAMRDHRRIIFNGNGYDDAWVTEAEKRGLSNLKTTPDALARMMSKKNVELFTKFAVFTEKEMESRHEIFLENYSKTINIEALTMIDLVRRDVIPAVVGYKKELAEMYHFLVNSTVDYSLEIELLENIGKLSGVLYTRLTALEDAVVRVHGISDSVDSAKAYRETVFTAMSELRAVVDEFEMTVSGKYWTVPTYGEILYSVI